MDYIKFDKKAMRNDIKELLDYLCATFLNRMQCIIDEDDSGLYSKIVLVVDENSVVDSIRTSSSILKFENSSSASGYQQWPDPDHVLPLLPHSMHRRYPRNK